MKFIHADVSTSGFLSKLTWLMLIASVVLASPNVNSAPALDIAVIETQDTDQLRTETFRREISALFEGIRPVNFVRYPLNKDNDKEDASRVLQDAYANPVIDIVLVIDVAANQSLGTVEAYSKPTILPFVINAQMSGLPVSGNSSGKPNLNYITPDFDIEKELNTLRSIVPFEKPALISDSRIQTSLDPEVIRNVKQRAGNIGAELQVVPFNGDVSALALPVGTDAVLYGFISDSDQDITRALIDKINSLDVPSFSLVTEAHVRLGALATNSPTTDIKKLARRTALHIDEILSGIPAADLPILFESSSNLVINMATSRLLRVAPSFTALNDATLINELSTNTDQQYSLTQVARLAVSQNLSLAAQQLEAESADESVRLARSRLLPNISASVEYLTRKDDTTNVLSGVLAENTTDGSITLTQPLFVEENWAAYTVEKYLALSEWQLLREVELDIIQSAVNTYLNVLFEKTSLEQQRYNLQITRDNYRLAKNRVEVGSQTAADLYRWESEVAIAKQAVIQATASYRQQRQTLNQILNRPINEDFSTSVETLDNPDLLISDQRILNLVKDEYSLAALTSFFVERGLERSPEILQIQAQYDASERQLKSDQRSYWVPDVYLTGQVTSNFDEERSAMGTPAEDNDWSIGIELSIPLYEGSARSAQTAQSRLAVMQLETNLRDLRNQIENEIRNNMEALNASYNIIPLAEQAEAAALKNYELVNNSYSQGASSITEVLDAQESLITARQDSNNSVYLFLIDLMNVQRSVGSFDFFLTDTERMQLSDELIQRLN